MAITTPETTTRTAWAFDPAHSTVGFKTKHMMVTSVRGQFTEVEGKIVGDINDPTLAEVDVTINAASIDTRNEQRDAHLRTADFLDVENFPTITFRSTRIERTGDDTYKTYGDLTIRGTTRQVVLDTEVNGVGTNPWGAEVVGISLETSINRKDFGLNWNVALETGGFLVSDTVKIEIEIQAAKQS